MASAATDYTFIVLWMVSVFIVYLFVRERRRAAGLTATFAFPYPRYATMTLAFNSEPERGPFVARAVLVKGKTLRITHQDDPEAEGRQACAAMTECPFNFGKVHRTPLRFAIEGAERASGRLRLEVLDPAGKVVVREFRVFRLA